MGATNTNFVRLSGRCLLYRITPMTEDSELLRRYAETRSEAAFAELVNRRIALVYSVAIRQVGGDAHLAQDVTQRVFADLARKASALARRPVLTGWLYRSTHFAASDIVRSERRRRAREEEHFHMNQMLAGAEGGPADFSRLRPLIDHAMAELDDEDRDAVCACGFSKRRDEHLRLYLLPPSTLLDSHRCGAGRHVC
jgi:DNA-directed RNA polymerase specialized sigma24 family protein